MKQHHYIYIGTALALMLAGCVSSGSITCHLEGGKYVCSGDVGGNATKANSNGL